MIAKVIYLDEFECRDYENKENAGISVFTEVTISQAEGETS
jgi:hypothetical protein